MHSLSFGYDEFYGRRGRTEDLDDGGGGRGVERIDEPGEAVDQGGTDQRLLARDVFHTARPGETRRSKTSQAAQIGGYPQLGSSPNHP